MNSDLITPTELKCGDVLLCKIPPLSFFNYLSSIINVVRSYVSSGRFDLEAATPLIHWLIGYLDEGDHFHASFWNGTKIVESRIKGGLRANDIDTYKADIVDIYRFRKDNHWLGDPASLPVGPLLQKAQELVDRHWAYGFDSAYLLAILCVSRWPRAKCVDYLRDFLVRHAPSEDARKLIGQVIDQYRPQIDALCERLLVRGLDVVRSYLDQRHPGYVCSQTVAVIYNEAGDATHPVGTYTISKPNHALKASGPVLLVAPPTTDQEVAACERQIRDLGAELAKLPEPPARSLSASAPDDYDALQTRLWTDSFYTPRDLAESCCLAHVGRLDLTSQPLARPFRK